MADNLYAGSSVQVYADSSLETLVHTHEDTKGFLDYVARFNAPNFRITDDDVAQWRFDPVFDDADGWRGVDSVKAYYHSGHGGMSPSGVFSLPMGSTWATRTSAFSSTHANRRPEAALPLPQRLQLGAGDARRQPMAHVERREHRMPHDLRVREHLGGLGRVRPELLPSLEHRVSRSARRGRT